MVYYNNIPIVEGIDKITVTLNPTLHFNYSKMKIDPKQKLTLRVNNSKYQFRVYLDIHAEFINPFIPMRINIAKALYETIKAGFIDIPIIPDLFTVYYFIHTFVYEINTIEFFFDIFRTDFKIISPIGLKIFDTTIYSPDYRAKRGVRKSMLKIYDRATHLLQQNHIPHDKIRAYPYKWRFEVVLTKYNCPYLTLEDIKDSCSQIIQKYAKLIAITYNRYFKGKIEFNISDVFHPNLAMILNEAKSAGTRYRGNLHKHKTSRCSYIGDYRIIQFNNKKDDRAKQSFNDMLNMIMLLNK